MTTYEERKAEGVRRLEMWKKQGLMHCVLQKFKRKDTLLYYSDPMILGFQKYGSLFYLDDLGGAKQEWIELISEFETHYDATVYHVIHDKFSFGDEVLYLLYVSNSPIEWEEDREDIEEHRPFVYALNLSTPQFSEFGNIFARPSGGGMIRTKEY